MATANELRDGFGVYYDVEPNTGCWLWFRAGKGEKGYGSTYLNGRQYGAHRALWIVHNGEMPDGLWVLHKCDTPECVNPHHLYLGTPHQNNMDAVNRGRQVSPAVKGRQNGMSKLDTKAVIDIRESLRNGERKTEIARRYGVSPRAIRFVEIGATWSWYRKPIEIVSEEVDE